MMMAAREQLRFLARSPRPSFALIEGQGSREPGRAFARIGEMAGRGLPDGVDGFPVGDRTGGRARVRSDFFLPLRRPGSGARRWGIPAASYVAGLRARRPSSRPRKAPRRRHGRR